MYKIKLENFEGPLDLLLFFVRKDELNIYDIPIAHITRSYLEYLQMMQELNLDIASEFILMAATLMRIKVKCMLPPEPGEETEEEPLDPREELTRRLLEYRQFKEASKTLAELDEQWRLVYRRNFFDPDRLPPSDEPIGLKNVSFFDLLAAYKKAISRSAQVVYHNIERINVTVDQQMNYIRNFFNNRKGYLFTELCEGMSKIEIVVTFLALLELIRQEEIFVRQSTVFDDIWIQKEPIPDDELPEPVEPSGVPETPQPDNAMNNTSASVVENSLTDETDHPDIAGETIPNNPAEEVGLSADAREMLNPDEPVSDLLSDAKKIHPVTELSKDEPAYSGPSKEFCSVISEQEKQEDQSLKTESTITTLPSFSLEDSENEAPQPVSSPLQQDLIESVDSALAPSVSEEARDKPSGSLCHEYQKISDAEENGGSDADHTEKVQTLSEKTIEEISSIILDDYSASERASENNAPVFIAKIPSDPLDLSEVSTENINENPVQDLQSREQNSNQLLMIEKEQAEQPADSDISNESDDHHVPMVETVHLELSIQPPVKEHSENLKTTEVFAETENSVCLHPGSDSGEYPPDERQSEMISRDANSLLSSHEALTQEVDNIKEHNQETESPIGRFFKKIISFVKKIFSKKKA